MNSQKKTAIIVVSSVLGAILLGGLVWLAVWLAMKKRTPPTMTYANGAWQGFFTIEVPMGAVNPPGGYAFSTIYDQNLPGTMGPGSFQRVLSISLPLNAQYTWPTVPTPSPGDQLAFITGGSSPVWVTLPSSFRTISLDSNGNIVKIA